MRIKYLERTLALVILSGLIITLGCQTSSQATKDNDVVEIPIQIPSITPNPTKPTTPETYSTTISYPLGKENFISLAWFSKPPDQALFPVLAQNFDLFILTHKDESEREILKNMGVNAPFLQYILMLEIQDPGDCNEEPRGNQVAYQTGDYCNIITTHPEWLLTDTTGEPIRYDEDSVAMDPGNPGYRAFWLERVQEMQSRFGWDGLFIDNVEASIRKVINRESLPAQYSSDIDFTSTVNDFLNFIRNNYSGLIFGNIVSVNDTSVVRMYSQYLDGIMIEAFAVDWSDGFLSADEWNQQMTLVEQLLLSGQTVVLVSQGSQDNTDRQEFAFVSYMLINNGKAVFRYAKSDNYRGVWLYPNYFAPLGLPLGERYRVKNEWRRDFDNGYLVINPANHKSHIHINP